MTSRAGQTGTTGKPGGEVCESEICLEGFLPDDDAQLVPRPRGTRGVLHGSVEKTPCGGVRNLGTPMPLRMSAAYELWVCDERSGHSVGSLVAFLGPSVTKMAPELAWNAWRSAPGGGDHASRRGEEPRDADGALDG